MTILSIRFIAFIIVITAAYYLLPKRFQWPLLLGASLLFYVLAGSPVMLIFLLFSILSTYGGALLIQSTGHKKLWFALTVLLNLGILLVLKYTGFLLATASGFLSLFGLHTETPALSFILPLGLSFYTFQAAGYLTDVYRGVAAPQKNLGKYALFCCYFPQIMSGPIGRYSDLSPQLYSEKSFDNNRLIAGASRLIWGFFKKLVISERLGIFVNTVFEGYQDQSGLSVLLAAVFYALQLYTDFSGYMDIVLGFSEMLNISMAENFTAPFFSESISEFWRRWHITLGSWLRDYLFYPLLKSAPFMGLSDRMRKRFGKKAGKKIPSYLALFILWFTIGLWHGADWKYIFGVGLLQWLCIVSGELMQPVFKRLKRILRIQSDSAGFRLFCRCRTFLIMCFSFLFFRADGFGDAVSMLGVMLGRFNLRDLWDGSLLNLGFTAVDYAVVLLSILLLWYMDRKSCRAALFEGFPAKQAVFRWGFYYLMIFSIILFGVYGQGYDAGAFTYFQF